jgi:predicted ATP-grasp superfamily ATP-dependent carboligase
MYYDDDANADSTLMSRLTELNKALSQMMRNTSERKIVEELHTYQLAIKKTLSVMSKKQLLTKSETSNEYEDRLERGDFS